MGLLDLLFGGRAKAKPKAAIATPEPAPKARAKRTSEDAWCDLQIVGESNYQEALARICGGYARDGHQLHTRAHLVPEPSNPYDENAVSVEIDGQRVGYLKRADAARYVTRLTDEGRAGEIVEVRAYISGGWRTNQHDQGHFGVQLETPWPLKKQAAKRR